jgi:predicted metal-dependent phosphoesterase TrpH
MEFDLHIHTKRYSGCSNIDPLLVLKKASDVGLNGIALTEHGIRWSDDEIEDLVVKSGVQHVLVIPGQEAACYSNRGEFQGEFLVFGYQRSLGSNKSIDQLVELVHGEGGVVIAAHPFKRMESGTGFYGSGYVTPELNIDGLEIEHPSYDEEGHELAKRAMMTMRTAGLGCSDAHDLRQIGVCRTVFENDIGSVAMLCGEIRACRVKAVNHNTIAK